MRNFLLVLTGTVLLLFSCTKKEEITSPATGSPANIPYNDGFSMPLTKGNYWKYQRIDTAKNSKFTSSDTSDEVITVVGDTLFSSIDPINRMYVLQINNLTKKTLDTNFILYTKDWFALYGHPSDEAGNVYIFGNIDTIIAHHTVRYYTSWALFVQISLPANTSPFSLGSISLYRDTTYTRVDTSLVLPAAVYTGSVFILRNQYTMGMGQSQLGGGHNEYRYFMKPGTGIIYMRQSPYSVDGAVGAGGNVFFSSWYIRRLVDYKIQ